MTSPIGKSDELIANSRQRIKPLPIGSSPVGKPVFMITRRAKSSGISLAENDLTLSFIQVVNAQSIHIDIMWLKGKIWQVLEALFWCTNNWHGCFSFNCGSKATARTMFQRAALFIMITHLLQSHEEILERIAALVREAISHSIGINVQCGIQNTGEKLHAFTATNTYARQLIGGLRILYS